MEALLAVYNRDLGRAAKALPMMHLFEAKGVKLLKVQGEPIWFAKHQDRWHRVGSTTNPYMRFDKPGAFAHSTVSTKDGVILVGDLFGNLMAVAA